MTRGEKSITSNISLSGCLTIVWVMLYKVLLDISYITILSPTAGSGLYPVSYSPLTLSLGFITALCLCICMPKKINTVSDFVLNGLVLISAIPQTTVYSVGGGNIEVNFIFFAFFLICFALVRLTPTFSLPSPSVKVADIIFVILLWGFAIYVLVRCISAMGFSAISLDFSTIYQRRVAYKNSGIAGDYLMGWSGNAVFPCCAAYFLYRKKYLNVAVAAFCSVFIFGVSGMKSILFGMAMVIGVYFLFQLKERMSIISFGFMIMVVACILCFVLLGNFMPYSLAVRRLCILPAEISNMHFEFFDENGTIELGNSIFSSFVYYPYSADPADIIGPMLYNSTETHANSGIYIDGFTHFGYIGVFMWAVLFSLLMKLQDCVSKNKPLFVTCGFFALYITIFSNSALLTSIMTHGFVVVLVLALLVPKSDIKVEKAVI